MQHDGCSLNNSRTVLTYSLASTTQVVAVKLTNTIINGRVHGLLGSMPDGRIVTDDTWKCTAHLNQSSETKWMKASYNDSLWPNAVIQGLYKNIHPVTLCVQTRDLQFNS
jgi:hypothetical protein